MKRKTIRLSPHYRFRPRVPERELQHSFVCDMPESMLGAELLALVAAPDCSHVEAITGDRAEGATYVGASGSDAARGTLGPAAGMVDEHIDQQGDGQRYVNGENPTLPPPRTRFFPLGMPDSGTAADVNGQR